MKTKNLHLHLHLPNLRACGIFLLFCFSIFLLSAQNYVQNREPLAQVPFYSLPVGSVKAQGWLLTQLQLQKNGLTGYAEELYNGAGDLGAGSDWLGGTGDSWERAPYYVKGLIALAYTLDDAELKTKAQKWIDWSLNNQQANGFFGPAGNTDWWARMPMLYAIRDYYEATNDARVIPFLKKYFQYEESNINSRQLSDWGKSRAGDNMEIVFWLYNRTGDSFLLSLAEKLKAQAYPWTDIFTNNKFNYFGGDFQPKHNVNVPQAMKMPAIYWQKSKTAADSIAYFAGREHLHHDHGKACGMQSGNEMLAGRSSMTGLELCSVVEQMQTSETAQMILGDATIGDQLEKVAFNALPGGLSHDIKGMSYYQQANQVISKFGNAGFWQNYDNGLLRSPFSGYGCCRFDFHHGYPYYVKNMWAATADNGLAAMAYGPCTVTALVANNVQISITENTDYPFDSNINVSVNLSQSATFPLKFRIPSWCNAPEIKVNGVAQTGISSGSFYTINRTWNNNDLVAINFPMHIQVNEEVNNSVSIQYGALVFALKIDETHNIRQDWGNGFTEFEALPASAWNYALQIDREHPENSIQVNTNPNYRNNPFNYANTPVTLTVMVRKLPSWTMSHNERVATDPPFSPVESSEALEQITLVPYGVGTLRVSCFPTLGTKNMITSTFSENFDTYRAGWVQYSGSFYVENGEYVATNTHGNASSKSVFTATDFSNFTYTAKVQLGANGDAGLMFRASRFSFGADDYNGYYVGISAKNNNVVLGKANGTWNQLTSVAMNINANEYYNLKIVANASNIKIYVNDMNTPKINFNDNSYRSGCIGVRSWDALAKWDNLSVVSATAGAKQLKASDNIKILPNPAKNYVEVLFADNEHKIYNINLLNMNGSLLQSKNKGADVSCVQFDTQHLAQGTYLVQIMSATDLYQQRFIKN